MDTGGRWSYGHVRVEWKSFDGWKVRCSRIVESWTQLDGGVILNMSRVEDIWT